MPSIVQEKILDIRPAPANAPACRSLQRQAAADLTKGEDLMRLSVASSALAAAFVLTPVAAGYAPALSQDFSITNQVEPSIAGHRDLMPQLQAWWDMHAYYPRHASNNDEGGTVKVHLVILPDGRVWTVTVVASSGSRSLDTAGEAVFHNGFVRPFPEGEAKANTEVTISLHYVLAHQHNQPVAAGYTPVVSKGPFTIMNDPVRSPILETMLQRTCTGTVVRGGITNHPWYGMRSWAQAIFFRKPDGTPWVKFYEFGYPTLAAVTEVGKMLTWTGREENPKDPIWVQYTVWPDGENHLSGAGGSRIVNRFGIAMNSNVGISVDLTCATEVLPAVTWNDFLAQSKLTSPVDLSPSDPP
jgi:TonB family protein